MSKKTPLLARITILVGGLIFIIGIASWWYVRQLLTPLDPSTTATKVITIKRGASLTAIGATLEEAGIIKSKVGFRLAVYLTKTGNKIQAGSFRLSPSMTPEKVAQELTHGTLDMWVTVVEGWRKEEIADELAKTFAEQNNTFDKSQFLELVKTKEGYLFPDTYLFPLTATAADVATLLETTLEKKLTNLQTGIQKSGHSIQEIMTMASLIEREAKSDEARKVVAGILWKRIQAGWPLQVDATLQYVKGYSSTEKTWWSTPLAQDKDINSRYNTYKNTGLPPAPICSPSLSSITAAIFPTNSDYWFYLTDHQGVMHYAKTLDEHNVNISAFLR